jgi:hypothetical protein
MKKMAADIQEEYFAYVKKDYVKAISVYDEKGTIVYSTAKDAIGRNYSKCDFFQWATRKENKGRRFISSLFFLRSFFLKSQVFPDCLQGDIVIILFYT